MKRIFALLFALFLLALPGCSADEESKIAATTLPVYEFTSRLCEGTQITITRLVTENVSCLHDYTLQTRQMRAIEGAELVIINGAGLEEFLEDALHGVTNVADCSEGLSLVDGHNHDHEHDHNHGHVHGEDPHIWLSPENAKIMAHNICHSLSEQYPAYGELFQKNLDGLIADLDSLQAYGEEKLSDLSCRDLVTFHDGFTYLAESFDLHIIRAIEEESGSEASAAELIELIELVRQHQLPAIFIETNGSLSAAEIIAAETDVQLFSLDMVMAGDSYFESMYHNIDTLWEALQ